MNQYKSVQEIPSYFKMTNPVKTSGETKKDDSCQPSFTYFHKDDKPSVYWGSEKPLKEVCFKDFKAHSGIPNHSIWNNSTKRKTIVDRVV